MSATQRLASLGLTLPEVANPVGTYVPALRHGDLVYTSGQLPFVDGALLATGHVGQRADDVSPERAAECARAAALNALAAAARAAGGLDSIVSVVKVTGFVSSAPDFTQQPAILNAASALMVDVFGDAGRHARSAVGVAALPLGAPVEVEIVVAVRQ
ncbi:RidA family protein [Demequina capsici]|uniref:RidA family protein n=1 Tax=Demequina capsici TaxID=3075620 RepID=A0AA96F6L2_9MICO|nr:MULTISPECIES: RidA family protein [unclassified Demequina]WNM24274.1 RidA family protein [Demequina sp. OYTSA14]WNM27102.1 RidA family protein [Demequina sp. PMTSA13]